MPYWVNTPKCVNRSAATLAGCCDSQIRSIYEQTDFVLVNEKGAVLGTLADEGGRPALKLFDEHSQEIWSAGGKIGFRTAALGR